MKNFQQIVEKIARENGTTPDHVMQQMRQAIDLAYDRQSPESAPLWAGLAGQGKRPTVEQFVLGLALMMQPEGEQNRRG